MVDDVSGHSFEELKVLGVGGQASVSLCRDTHTGKLVALKTSHPKIHREEAVNKEDRFDLQREYDIAKFLVDSNVSGVVPVHSMCEDDSTGQLCMLMDYCDGGTLFSELQGSPNHRLSERKAAIVLSSLAKTLESCHKLGIMHRDVKPENVLIQHGHGGDHDDDDDDDKQSSNGKRRRTRKQMTLDDDKEDEGYSDRSRFLLADFGLACRFRPGHRIRDEMLVGTSEYMAPEMMNGAYDERADVWSLGVVLHLMLTGHFPFEDPQQGQGQGQKRRCSSAILARMLACPHKLDMEASSPVYEHLSRGARALLQVMLRKDPHHRIALSGIRSHPWLLQSSSSSQHGCNASFVGVKRIRFVTHAGPDIVRELCKPSPASSSSSSHENIVYGSGSAEPIKRTSFAGAKQRIHSIERELCMPALASSSSSSSSSSEDDDDDHVTGAIEPKSLIGPKRIRFITQGFPDIVRELHTALPPVVPPAKINNNGKAYQQQANQGSLLARVLNLEHKNFIQVPRRPRQRRHRPRFAHRYDMLINPLISLQDAY